MPVPPRSSSNGARRPRSQAPTRNPLGRPPAGDALETRTRILRIARSEFGKYGYSGTTTKAIAEGADLTIGALYYYFPTKQDLFITLYRDVYERVFKDFTQAIVQIDGLANKISAVLDAAISIHAEDPSLAAFMSVAPSEVHRHESLSSELRGESRAVQRFFEVMIESSPGDLAPGVDPHEVVALLVGVMQGFATLGATASRQTHRIAVEGFKRLLHGELFAVERVALPAG